MGRETEGGEHGVCGCARECVCMCVHSCTRVCPHQCVLREWRLCMCACAHLELRRVSVQGVCAGLCVCTPGAEVCGVYVCACAERCVLQGVCAHAGWRVCTCLQR